VSVAATTWSRNMHHPFDREARSQHVRQGLVLPMPPGGQSVRLLQDAANPERLSIFAVAPGVRGYNSVPEGALSMHTQLTWSLAYAEFAFLARSPR